MSHASPTSTTLRWIERTVIDAAITESLNAAGAERGLAPIAWRLGSLDEGIHLFGHADAHPVAVRAELIEAWIVHLGLADAFEDAREPTHQVGADVFWTGTVDDVTMQLRYPASTRP
ncbi:hypothetical protein DZF92_01355 [Clavibacter michiganensis subsp. insidiosus]|uniref:Uncharacterized protein n=1 Tax=Clavibacter michiganensis subsp. insidiosus TaxID=33014 RepID=A0A399SLB4_9MICO|nr:hypothetical protein DZF92_01355 [Clavibacter michiganensis subsp. insidiosus]RIJ44410.1 hypothetical protein DZF93_02920 [Clavibacter michiganensis subsp. insidiosus]RMC84416.1 hypothetical protein CmiCFBP2404_11810 [Clavibacter michiganensis subsp. insidiosus]